MCLLHIFDARQTMLPYSRLPALNPAQNLTFHLIL